MRVLHVTPTYYPNVGGIEAVIRNLCVGLKEHGHDCAVAHLSTNLSASSEIDAVGNFPVYGIPLRGNRLLGLAPGLAEIAEDFDILHVHDPQLMAITASVLRYARNKPRVLSSHGFYGHTAKLSVFKTLHRQLLFGRILSRYQAVLASSKSDFAHASAYAENVVTFENGVDTAAFAVPRAPGSRDLRKWLFWGRISRNKRPDLLVDVVHALHQRGEAIELVIAGPEFDDMPLILAERRRALGMEKSVRISGPLDQVDLLKEISRAGIFASATEYEGFGLTFIEAMAGGLGILCRDKPPMAEFAKASHAGLVVDFDDIDTSAVRIVEFLNKHPSSIAENAEAYAAKYDWAQKIPILAGIYEQTIADYKTPSLCSSS